MLRVVKVLVALGTLAAFAAFLWFARTRVEMKAIETVLHLRREPPRRMKAMVPEQVWKLVEPYGLEPRPDERG